jgi:hypothetical protein
MNFINHPYTDIIHYINPLPLGKTGENEPYKLTVSRK